MFFHIRLDVLLSSERECDVQSARLCSFQAENTRLLSSIALTFARATEHLAHLGLPFTAETSKFGDEFLDGAINV
jgi:hypothetical protein